MEDLMYLYFISSRRRDPWEPEFTGRIIGVLCGCYFLAVLYGAVCEEETTMKIFSIAEAERNCWSFFHTEKEMADYMRLYRIQAGL